jgi:hypothetical protein
VLRAGLRKRLGALWADGLRRVGEELFRRDDAFARQHGWETTVLRGGPGRRYRDPRFDDLCACTRCNGRGEIDREPCVPCAGTGRVRRTAAREGRLP